MIKSKHRFTLPSNHSFGQPFFLLFFVCMVILAGYLYLTHWSVLAEKPDSQMAAIASPAQNLGLIFIHPLSSYSLSLPFSWRNQYVVTEESGGTVFYYIAAGGGASARLFKIKAIGQTEDGAPGKKIGELAGQSFWLETAAESGLTGRDKDAWQKMADDIPAISRTWRAADNDQNATLKKFLAGHLSLSGTSTLPILSYEVLATQETGSSTKLYLWVLARTYAWREDILSYSNDVSMPLVAYLNKNVKTADSAFGEIKEPRSGRSYAADIKKLFPPSVTQNAIFKDGTLEHLGLLQKLDDDLSAMTLSYFGADPVLTTFGWLKKFDIDNGNLVATIYKAGVEKLPPAATSTKSKIAAKPKKCLPTVPVCELSGYQIKNSDKAGYRFVVATSTTVLIDNTAQSLVEFTKSFAATSTSPLKNQVYKFDLQSDRVIRINALQ